MALWTGDTVSQLDGNSGLQYGALYVDFVIPAYTPNFGIVYTLNGYTTTGDWYIVGVGYDLGSLAYYSGIGCGSGFDEVLLVTNNAGSTVASLCATGVTFAAGDTVTLGLNYTASSPGNMGLDACVGASCGDYYIAQPDTGATGLSVQTTARSSANGGFTGDMTWVMNPSSSACATISGLPMVDYDYHQGTYESEYIPWSQSYYFSTSTSCFDSTSSIGLAPEPAGSPYTLYTQAPASSSYGTHWVAAQNVSLQSALSGNYWWRFQTDVSPLTIPTVSASRGTADVGQVVNFMASTSGGISPYQYDWYLNAVLQSRVSPPWGWTPLSPASDSVTVNVIDSDYDYLGPSAATTVSVTSDPSVAIPTALPISGGIDLGQSVTFTSAAPTGGLGPYTYVWTSLPTGCSNSGTSSDVCVPSASGSFAVAVTVTDANAFAVVSPALTYVVDGPLSASLSVAPAVIDLGQSFNLTVSATGGASPYSYTYANLPTGCSTANVNPFLCTPTSSGSYTTIAASVTDANSASSPTSSVSVTVNPDMILTSFAANPSSLTQGGTTYLNVSFTGGTTPYTYSYSALPTGCVSSNVASLACLPTTTGNFSIGVLVTDAAGRSVTKTTVLTVTAPIPPLAIGSFTVSPSNVTLGTSTTFTVSASGGYSPYSYAYSNLPTGCSSSNQASFSCAPTVTGTFHVGVTVTDAKSGSATSSTTLTVAKLSGGGPVISSFTVTPSKVVVSSVVTFTVVVSGGTAPLSYAYAGLPPGCSSTDSATLTCTPTSAGTFNVTVTVDDVNSKSATAVTTLTVTPSGSGGGPIIGSFVASPGLVSVNQTTSLSTAVSGGSTPYSYAYASLPAGCASSNSNPLSCKPATPGNYTITVTVTDNLGRQVSSQTGLTVTGRIVALTVRLTSNLSAIQVGQAFTLTASASGGLGQDSYLWVLNGTSLSSVAGTPVWSQTLAHPGNYNFSVWVTDSRGVKVESSGVMIHVTPKVVSGNPASGSFPWWLLLLILIVVVTLLVFFVVERRRRQAKNAMAEGAYVQEDASGLGEGGPTPDTFSGSGPEMLVGETLAGGSMSATSVPTVQEDGSMSGSPIPELSAEGPVPAAFEVAPEIPMAVPPSESPDVPPTQEYVPSEPPLTNCPQCGGALGADLACPTCGVSWVPERPEVSAEAQPLPIQDQSLEPGVSPSPPPLTHCPICMSPLDPELNCQQCGVSWVKDQVPEPSLPLSPGYQVEVTMITPTPPEYEPQVSEAAPVSVPGKLGPDTAAAPTSSGTDVAPPEPLSPAPVDSQEAGATQIQQELEQVQRQAQTPPEEPLSQESLAVPSSANETSPPATRTNACFICGTLLEGDFCPTCDMHWDGRS